MFWQETVQLFEAGCRFSQTFSKAGNAAMDGTIVDGQEAWKFNPLVSNENFEKFFIGLPSMIKEIHCELSKEFDLGNGGNDQEETQIEELINSQNNITQGSTDLKSAHEHVLALKNLGKLLKLIHSSERKCCKIIKEKPSISLDEFKKFWQFLVLVQAQRQLQPPNLLLHTLESKKQFFVEVPNVAEQITQALQNGKNPFHEDSISEQFLTVTLKNVYDSLDKMSIEELVHQLELALGVFKSNPKIVQSLVHDTFSKSQLRMLQCSEDIAARLAKSQGPANSVIRGYLCLAILTGNLQYLLEVVNSSKVFPAQALVEADDLLALLLVIAKKFYLENASSIKFPLPNLTESKQRIMKVASARKFLDLPASKVFWNGTHLIVHDEGSIRRLKGDLSSADFGEEIDSIAAGNPYCVSVSKDSASNEDVVSIFETKSEVGIGSLVIVEVGTQKQEDLFAAVVNKANQMMKKQKFTLLDISINTYNDEEIVNGVQTSAYLFFSQIKDTKPKTLKVILNKIGEDNHEDVMTAWFNNTIKSVSNKFFKLNFVNIHGKERLGWWLAVFHWAEPQTKIKADDIEVTKISSVGYMHYVSDAVCNWANQNLDQRIVDLKSTMNASYGSCPIICAHVKDPILGGFNFLQEQSAGTWQKRAQDLSERMTKIIPKNFVCCDLKPYRSDYVTDKMIYISSYATSEVQAPAGRKSFGQFATQEWQSTNLDECFETLMKFLNEEVLDKGFTPIDFGVNLSEDNNPQTYFVYVLFDDKGVLPPLPGKILAVERFQTEQYNFRDETNKKVKEAGNRFWKLCVSARLNDAMYEVAILRWDDVVFNEIDIEVNVEGYDNLSLLTSSAKNKFKDSPGRKFIDYKFFKIDCNIYYVFVTVKQKIPETIYNLFVEEVPGSLKNVLQKQITKISTIQPETYIGSTILNTSDKEKKYLFLVQQCPEATIERVLSAQTFKPIAERDFRMPPNFEKFYTFQHNNQTFFFGFSNAKVTVIHGDKQVELISDQAPTLESNFKCLNTHNGNLVLQFEKHLITYSLAQIVEAAAKQGDCKPIATVPIDSSNSGTLFFQRDSAKFFFKCKSHENQICFYMDEPDKNDFMNNLAQNQPNDELTKFAANVEDLCKWLYEPEHEETEFIDIFRSVFTDKAPIGHSHFSGFVHVHQKISVQNLASLVLEVVEKMSTLQAKQQYSSSQLPMLMLASRYTLQQTKRVLSLLLELQRTNLSDVDKLRAMRLFFNHLLALRQNGRTVSELKIEDSSLGCTILNTLIQISEKVSSMQHVQSLLESCFKDFISLVSEYQRPEKFTVTSFPVGYGFALPSDWTIEEVDLPIEFLQAATGPIKIKKVIHSTYSQPYYAAFGFVFHNGVSEHRLCINLTSYSTEDKEIQNDRCWERSMHYRPASHSEFNTLPFALLGYNFDGNHIGFNFLETDKSFSNKIVVKEQLEDNETFVGVKFIKNSSNNIMDMSLKKGTMPNSTSVPIPPVLTLTSLESVKFNDTISEGAFLERLLTAKLPLSTPHSLIQDYEERALKEIVNSFSAKEPAADYYKALRQLTWISTNATKSKNGLIDSVKALFTRALDEKIKDPERFTPDMICSQTLKQMTAVLFLVDKQDIVAQVVRRISKAGGQPSAEDKIFAAMDLFKICSNLICMSVRDFLMTKPVAIKEGEDVVQADEQTVAVDLLNQSDLFSGGLDKKNMFFLSEKTRQELNELKDFMTLYTEEDFKRPVETEQEKLLDAVITSGKDKRVDDVINALQQIILKQPKFRATAMSQGALGFKLVRMAFAVMVDFSGLITVVEKLVETIELQEDIEATKDEQSRIQAVVKIFQTNKASSKLSKLWESATKMRAWLGNQKNVLAAEAEKKFPMQELHLTDEEKQGLTEEQINEAEQRKTDEEHARVKALREEEEVALLEQTAKRIQDKVNFLILLEHPEFFDESDPDVHNDQSKGLIKQLSQNLDLKRAATEPAKPTNMLFAALQNRLRGKYAELKQLHQDTQNFKNQQEKLNDLREAGTASVLACLQANISVEKIKERVEHNFVKGMRRLTGLNLLANYISFVSALDQNESTDQYVSMAVECLCQCLQTSKDKLYHYMDDLQGCGKFLEQHLRDNFFKILKSVFSYYDSKNVFLRELIPCFQWNYRGRDFKQMLSLHILKRLVWGKNSSSLKLSEALDLDAMDPVVKAHYFDPSSQLAKSLYYTFVDIVVSILNRVAEETSEHEQIGISHQNTQVTLQRTMSVVDSSDTERLLSQAFEIIFTEFELFNEMMKEFSSVYANFSFEGEKNEDLLSLQADLIHAINKKKLARGGNEVNEQAQDEEQKAKVHNLQKLFQGEVEQHRIHSLLSLVSIFVSIATNSSQTQKQLHNITEPKHIQTLLRLFQYVSIPLKIQILHLFQNLMATNLPHDVISIGCKGIESGDDIRKIFKNPLAQVLYGLAVIHFRKHSSSSEKGVYDLFIHITKIIRKCLQHEPNQQSELTHVLETVQTFPKDEQSVIFAILGAHHQRFVHQDRLLSVSEQKMARFDFNFDQNSYLQRYIVCPEKNDLQLVFSPAHINTLIKIVVNSESNDAFVGHILKLLCMQHSSQNLEDKMSEEARALLIDYLVKIAEQPEPQCAITSSQTTRYLEFLLSNYGFGWKIPSQETAQTDLADEEAKAEEDLTEVQDNDEKPDVTITLQPMRKVSERKETLSNPMQGLSQKPKMRARMSIVRQYIQNTGACLHELVFGLCTDASEFQADKKEFEAKLDFILSSTEENRCFDLTEFLEDRMAFLTEPIRVDDLVTRLNGVDVGKVKESLGSSIRDKLTRVRQSFFSNFLAKASDVECNATLDSVFTMTLKTENLADAKKVLQSSDKEFRHDTVEKNAEGAEERKYQHNISDLTKAYKYRLALRLLFALTNPSKDLASNQAISRASLLMKYFSLSAAELSEDGAGCIWECQFKSHIAEQLALPVDEQTQDFQIYEGEEINIHKVVAVVEYPSLDQLRRNMLYVFNALQASSNGSQLVNFILQGQVIDSFVARCLSKMAFSSASAGVFDKLRLQSEESMRKHAEEKKLKDLEKNFGSSVWFVYDKNEDSKHIITVRVLDKNKAEVWLVNDSNRRVDGSWKIVSPTMVEVTHVETFEDDPTFPLQFEWTIESVNECKSTNKPHLFAKRQLQPHQLIGTWSWCHDGKNRDHDLVLSENRKGKSENYYDSYWWFEENTFRINIRRTSYYDSHFFKQIDDKTLELVEPARDPPTRLLRQTAVPLRKHPLRPDLHGEWDWCHDGVNQYGGKSHALLEGGIVRNENNENGRWSYEFDESIRVDRLYEGDKHLFRFVDENLIVCFDPERNPSTTMRRVNRVQIVDDSTLRVDENMIQTNALVLNLMMTSQWKQADFWEGLIPQLFDMMLFQLSLKSTPVQARILIEQCQMLLWTITQNVSPRQSTLLANLVQSPMLLRILQQAQDQGYDEKTNFLNPILIADMLVQIKQAAANAGQQHVLKSLKSELKKIVKQGVTCDKGDILTLRTTFIEREPFTSYQNANIACSICRQSNSYNYSLEQGHLYFYTCCFIDTDCDFICCKNCFKGEKATLGKMKCYQNKTLELRYEGIKRYGGPEIRCNACSKTYNCEEEGVWNCEDAQDHCELGLCKDCYSSFKQITGVVCDKGKPLVRTTEWRKRTPDCKQALCNLCPATINPGDAYYVCCDAEVDCDFDCCENCFKGCSTKTHHVMGQTCQLLETLQSQFASEIHADFDVQKAFLIEYADTFGIQKELSDEEVTAEIAKVQSQWTAFSTRFTNAFKNQFVTDCIDTVNNFIKDTDCNDFNSEFLTNAPKVVSGIEFSGDSFSSEDDKKLARVVITKLFIINALQQKLIESKLDHLFDSEPFAFASPGLGLPTACRDWSNTLKSRKRFMLDKVFEKVFKEFLSSLPIDQSEPTIEFNRFAARRFADSGKVDDGEGDSLFAQMMRTMKHNDPNFNAWRKNDLGSKVYRANFQHEASIDAGGPYRAAGDWICKEVQSSVLPLLVPTENQKHSVGVMRDMFVLNHLPISEKELEMFFVMGCWVGNAIRTGQPLNLMLHPTVWKRIVGQTDFTLHDLKTADMHKFNEIAYIREAASQCSDDETYQSVIEQNFTVTIGGGKQARTIELVPGGFNKKVNLQNYEDYIRLAVNAILTKDQVQMDEFKRGIYHVLSTQAMTNCSWRYAQLRACGNQLIDIPLLKQYTNWNVDMGRMLDDGRTLHDAFWKVLEELSEENKQFYLKFVTGRAKLPIDIANEPKRHTVNSMGGNNKTLPQSHTCFNTLDLPPYTNEEEMKKRFITAIQFCGEIDTDGSRSSY